VKPHAGAEHSPPVVVVVVSRDPTPARLDALLAALAAQDYPNYRVLVIDPGSTHDPSPSVTRTLPDARVLRLGEDDGFGASANHVLDFVEGAELFVFSHDDVVPEPDAVSALVEVAEEYGAGIVGPKLVAWDEPDRLLQVGMATDRVGTMLPFVERGELDQAQHDGLREVFVVPGAFTLVRADLFERIGGFDEAITFMGDDLSLCWRARLAGARVLVTSSTYVRHAEALAERQDTRHRDRLVDRHRLRTLLMCTSLPGLLLAVPRALLVTLAQVAGALLIGRGARAYDAVAAWPWNLRRLRSLVVARRYVTKVRTVSDRAVRKAQVRGLVGPRVQLRRLGGEAQAAQYDEDDRSGWTAPTAAVWAVLLAVFLFGSRHLITRFVPAVGELVPLGDHPGEMVAEWASGWRHVGLGQPMAAPTIVGVLGGLGGLLGGTDLLRALLTLGLIPVGIVGAHRMLRPVGLRRVQVAAALAYAAAPVPYNALMGGRWSALAAYAGAPWLLARLAAAQRVTPFAPGAARYAPHPHPLAMHVVAVGLATAVIGLLVPAAPLLTLVVGAGLALGSLLAMEAGGLRRLAVATVGGAAIGLLLHLPALVDLVARPARLEAWLGTEGTADLSALDLVRFDTGTFGSVPLGYALAVAALFPLLAGRAWRLAWAARAWGVALACWGLLLAQQQGWVRIPLPQPDVLLAPAAAGLAMAVGLGLAAYGADVRGRSYRLGFRRMAAAVAGLAFVSTLVPPLVASYDGWWGMPRGDFAGLLRFVDDDVTEIPSRILWVGDPDVMPGGAGTPWRDDLTYAASLEGGRTVRDLWPGDGDGATPRLGHALDLAVEGRTARLGRLLAPMAVQYVIVPLRPAPSPYSDERGAVPRDLIGALGAQLDLVQVQVDRAVVVYRNAAFLPARALVADDRGFDARTPADVQGLELAGFPVLLEHDGVGYRGTLPGGQVVVNASTASDRWRLTAGGQATERQPAFGWATAFDSGQGGEVSLTFEASSWYRLVLVAQAALWLAALVVVLRMRFGGDPTLPDAPVLAVGAGRAGEGGTGPGPGGGGPGGGGGSRRPGSGSGGGRPGDHEPAPVGAPGEPGEVAPEPRPGQPAEPDLVPAGHHHEPDGGEA
jgi:GT2 family glycosyltransferase